MMGFMRFILLWLCSLLVFILALIIFIFRPFHRGNNKLGTTMMSFFSLKLLGVKLDLRGKENLKRRSPCIFISNHQDTYDVHLFSYIFPENCVLLGKKSLIWLPFFGVAYWLGGNFFIDRFNKKKAKSSMEKITKRILREEKSVWIMPEGTRNRGKRSLLPFKKGAFLLAINAQIPIVPICFSSYTKKIGLNNSSSATEVLCEVMDPIDTSDLRERDTLDFMDQVYFQMKEKIESLDSELVRD